VRLVKVCVVCACVCVWQTHSGALVCVGWGCHA
jgi:hypothetical protein